MVFSHTSTRISHRYTHASSSSHLSMLSQSPSLSSLNHTANSHWLYILHMVMYVAMLLSPYIPPSPSTSPPLALGLFSVWFSSVRAEIKCGKHWPCSWMGERACESHKNPWGITHHVTSPSGDCLLPIPATLSLGALFPLPSALLRFCPPMEHLPLPVWPHSQALGYGL